MQGVYNNGIKGQEINFFYDRRERHHLAFRNLKCITTCTPWNNLMKAQINVFITLHD